MTTSNWRRSLHSVGWTVDDLAGLPDDGQRYEIVDGALLVSPYADVFHGGVVNRLRRALERQAPAGFVVSQGVGVSDRPTSYLLPDLFVARAHVFDKDGAALDPADVPLVVEVVSPGNAARDLVLKRHGYAAAGIASYWLVEPRTRTLTVLDDVGGGYREAAVVQPGRPWRGDRPFPVELDLAELF